MVSALLGSKQAGWQAGGDGEGSGDISLGRLSKSVSMDQHRIFCSCIITAGFRVADIVVLLLIFLRHQSSMF